MPGLAALDEAIPLHALEHARHAGLQDADQLGQLMAFQLAVAAQHANDPPLLLGEPMSVERRPEEEHGRFPSLQQRHRERGTHGDGRRCGDIRRGNGRIGRACRRQAGRPGLQGVPLPLGQRLCIKHREGMGAGISTGIRQRNGRCECVHIHGDCQNMSSEQYRQDTPDRVIGWR